MWSLGIGVWWSTAASLISSLLSKLKARSTYFENQTCTKATLKEIDSAGLLEKASIITTPTAYSDGFINSVKPEQTLGSELVINGDFATDSDWTLESGWSISNGKLVGTLSNSTNAYQEEILEAGKKYKITYEITNYTQGGVRFQFVGGSTVNGLSRNGLGTYTEYLTATDSHNRIRFRSLSADGGFTGSIDNVSVKEVIDADFTFTRNTPATRVNAQGLVEDVQILSSNLVTNGDFSQVGSELITNGDFATNLSGWVLQNVDASNTITWEPSGARVISTSVNISLRQLNILTVGKTYKLTCDLAITTGRLALDGSTAGSTIQMVEGFNEITFTASSTNFIVKRYTGNDNCLIDNISVKEVGQGWSVGDGTADNYVEFTQGTARLKFLNTTPVTQLIATAPYEAGKKYKLIVDVASVTSGEIKIDSNNIQETFNTPGITTRIISPTGSNNIKFYRNTSNVDITLNSVSLIEITDDTDLPRINYEGFSYQDVLGSELVTNGDFATDSDWNKSTGWSISNNTAISDGSTIGGSVIQQTIQLVEGKTYQVILNVDSVDSGRVRFYSNFLGGGQADINSSGTFTYNVISSITGGRTAGVQARDAGTESVINSISVKEVLKQEVVPNSGCGSWLLEPGATNTATDSNDFTTGDIFVSSGNPTLLNSLTLTANATTSPDGLINASKIQIGSTSTAINRIRYTSVVVVSGNINTLSIFAKKGSGVDWFGIFVDGIDDTSRVWFDLENGVLGTSSSAVVNQGIEDYGNGWYRCSMSFTTSVDTSATVSFVITDVNGGGPYSGDLTDHHFIYGLQAESHATRQYATSYIPTSGSTVTRAADSALDAGSSDLISSTEGVLYFEAAALNSINEFGSISLSNGGTTERIRFLLNNNENIISIQADTGGGGVFFRSYTLSDITAFNKIAIKYKQDDYAIWINGVEEHTITSGAVPTLNKLNFSNGGLYNTFNGKVKCVAVFKEALTDAELTALTS